MKIVAFDIEIEKVVPSGEDLHAHHPLGISVAATWAIGSSPTEEDLRLWYGQGRPDGNPLPKMPQAQARVLVSYLERIAKDGYTIVTWNGLSFDFRVLAVESGLHQECVKLALGHVDPMFQFFCLFGYAVGLQACAKGFDLPGKTAGICGAQAPILWREGQYDLVKEYVTQDVRILKGVYETIQETDRFQWIDSRGRRHTRASGGRLLTVMECLALPPARPPHWISNPWPRSQFTKWMEGAL